MSNLDKIKKLTESLNKVEDNLKQERDIYKFLAESSNDGYWDWSMDFSIPLEDNYEYMSPRFWGMFGYTPDEKEHRVGSWLGMINQDDAEIVKGILDKHIETKGEFPYNQIVRYTHKDGSEVQVLCKGMVVSWSDDGTPLRMVGTHTLID